MSEIPDFKTLEEAKLYLRKNWEKGVRCPCCGQHVQLYNYKLFASSAFAIMRLYQIARQNDTEEWFHVKDYAEAGEDRPRAHHFAEMRFWGLVEPMPKNDDPSKKSSGYWRITDKGKRFVEGKLKVRSRILIFNNKFAGYAPNSELITVREALGNKFDYEELMA